MDLVVQEVDLVVREVDLEVREVDLEVQEEDLVVQEVDLEVQEVDLKVQEVDLEVQGEDLGVQEVGMEEMAGEVDMVDQGVVTVVREEVEDPCVAQDLEIIMDLIIEDNCYTLRTVYI